MMERHGIRKMRGCKKVFLDEAGYQCMRSGKRISVCNLHSDIFSDIKFYLRIYTNQMMPHHENEEIVYFHHVVGIWTLG